MSEQACTSQKVQRVQAPNDDGSLAEHRLLSEILPSFLVKYIYIFY